MSSRQRVVVCGASGMIGSSLVSQLLRDGVYDISVVVGSKESLDKLRCRLSKDGVIDRMDSVEVHYSRLDDVLSLSNIFKGGDIIFNCAASVDFSVKNSQHIIRDNTLITAAIIEAMHRSGLSLIVHLSSIAALDNTKYLIDDNSHFSTLNERSPYAVSKFYSDCEVVKARYMGIESIIVRPSVVLGSGSWRGGHISALFSMIYKRMPLSFSGQSGYVDVLDVVDAMLLLAQNREARGQSFILSSANITFKELFDKIALAYGRKRVSLTMPKVLLRVIAKVLSLLESVGVAPSIPSKSIESLYSNHKYDGSKIERFTSFTYRGIDDTIARIAKEYLKSRK